MQALYTIGWFLALVVSILAVFKLVSMAGLTMMFPEGRRWWHLPMQAIALAVFAVVVLCHPFKRLDDTIDIVSSNYHAIANTYFRIGEQAALVASQRRQQIEKDMDKKYPDGNFGTNHEDFEIAGNYLMAIDDPRIFEIVREMSSGQVFGLDTNNWNGYYSDTTNYPPHIWTILNK